MIAISILWTLKAYDVHIELQTKLTRRHRQLSDSIRLIFSDCAMLPLQNMVLA